MSWWHSGRGFNLCTDPHFTAWLRPITRHRCNRPRGRRPKVPVVGSLKYPVVCFAKDGGAGPRISLGPAVGTGRTQRPVPPRCREPIRYDHSVRSRSLVGACHSQARSELRDTSFEPYRGACASRGRHRACPAVRPPQRFACASLCFRAGFLN